MLRWRCVSGVAAMAVCLVSAGSSQAQVSRSFYLANADVIFEGIGPGDHSGYSISSAGDVNLDGIDDLLIGAPSADPNGDSGAGETYLVYGRSGPAALSGVFDLANADVIFEGIDPHDLAGCSVSSAGDFNDDGIDDVLIGARLASPNGDSNAGEAYLIYGRPNPGALTGVFDLASADVIFEGIDQYDESGGFVSLAGDVNLDGIDDLLIAAHYADPNGDSRAGETYLVYGRSGPGALSGVFDLANADVIFEGIDPDDYAGWPVSSAGDVNGDGIDDLLIAAHYADPNGYLEAGETYLVYGRSGPGALSGVFDLANADVIFEGVNWRDYSGNSISSAGDVNGDGLGDLLIGAVYGDPNGDLNAGETYLVYGRSGPDQLSGTFDLANADVIFEGIDPDDESGASVSSAGDVNGDGIDDLLIGARYADPSGDSNAGEAYLVYGRSGPAALSGVFDLANADVIFEGIDPDDYSGYSLSSAGDVNGDGKDDLLIAARYADPSGVYGAGETYLVYGRSGSPDLDSDGDVDLDDYELLEAAMGGPGQAPGDPAADLDFDGDCDLRDFATFAAAFTGST